MNLSTAREQLSNKPRSAQSLRRTAKIADLFSVGADKKTAAAACFTKRGLAWTLPEQLGRPVLWG